MCIRDIAERLQRQQSGLPNRGQAKPVLHTKAMLLCLTTPVVAHTWLLSFDIHVGCRNSHLQEAAASVSLSRLGNPRRFLMPTSSASTRTRWQLSTERTSRDALDRTLAAGPGLTAITAQWHTRQTSGFCSLQQALWKLQWQAFTSPISSNELLWGHDSSCTPDPLTRGMLFPQAHPACAC